MYVFIYVCIYIYIYIYIYILFCSPIKLPPLGSKKCTNDASGALGRLYWYYNLYYYY